MSTTKQKQAARRNIKKAQAARAATAGRKPAARRRSSSDLSTAERNDLPDSAFAFPKERKEPLIDADHVRNAIARFDQVEDVTDAERTQAWKRIKTAAKKFDVEVEATSWRELFAGGKARKN